MKAQLTASTKKQLKQCAQKIREANDDAHRKINVAFQSWISSVACELKKAQALLAKSGSHESKFGEWLDEETPYSRQYAFRLMRADRVISVLSPIGDTSAGMPLPVTESQCRSLSTGLDSASEEYETSLRKIWLAVVLESQRLGEPITAALIRGVRNCLESVDERPLVEHSDNGEHERIKEPEQHSLAGPSEFSQSSMDVGEAVSPQTDFARKPDTQSPDGIITASRITDARCSLSPDRRGFERLVRDRLRIWPVSQLDSAVDIVFAVVREFKRK